MKTKNQVFFAAIFSCIYILTANAFAQSPVNEGTLTYHVNIEAPGESLPDDMKDFKPEIKISFKDEQSLVVFGGVPQLDGNLIWIDGKKHETHLGVKQDDKKYHVVIPEETLKKEQEENMARFDSMSALMNLFTPKDSVDTTNPAVAYGSVQLTDEKETILGYECRKSTMKMAFMKFEFYTTESINLPSSLLNIGNMASGSAGSFDFSQIKGFPLKVNVQMDMFGNKVNIQLFASSFEKQPVNESLFKIPKEYKEISYEEFKAMGIH